MANSGDDAQKLIEFANLHAARLAGPPHSVGVATAAAQFLRQFAGADSDFYRAAAKAASDSAQFPNSLVQTDAHRHLAELLRSWADYVESGVASAKPFALAARIEASGDLMEQVSRLLEDRDVIPAVPVMLAGAALEEILRGMSEVSGAEPAGRPSITSYAEALKKVELLTANDVKDLTSLAGTRNEAAHGHFDIITKEVASLYVQRVAFFLAQHR